MENVTATLDAQREVTRLRDLKVGSADLIKLKPTDIEIEVGHNPRDYHLPENRAHLDQLKRSIKEEGFNTAFPLVVRFEKTGPTTGKAVLVDGECRLRSVLELITEGEPIESVPVIQTPGGNQADRLLTAIMANTGKPLSKWESGKAFVRFQKYGWEPEVIAKRTGFTLRFIQEAIELADAPQEVREMLSQQAVTPSLALSVMRETGNGEAGVQELKKRAEAAQAAGKKTATRSQNQPINTKALVNLVSKLIASVSEGEGDIFDTEYKFVEVDRATMVKIAALVGITEEKVKQGK